MSEIKDGGTMESNPFYNPKSSHSLSNRISQFIGPVLRWGYLIVTVIVFFGLIYFLQRRS